MIARYHCKVKNDDEYNKVRAKFGDTTDAQAQVLALRALGLTNSRFVTNCAPGLLESELRAGQASGGGMVTPWAIQRTNWWRPLVCNHLASIQTIG
jgi:hypothetical protein